VMKLKEGDAVASIARMESKSATAKSAKHALSEANGHAKQEDEEGTVEQLALEEMESKKHALSKSAGAKGKRKK